MAWTRFAYYASNAEIEAHLQVVAPIAGDSSLRIHRLSGSGLTRLAFAGSADAHGFLRGKIQILLRVDALDTNSHQLGLLCMQSANNVTSTGNCYGLRFRLNQFDLMRWNTNGIQTSAETQLATTTITLGSGVHAIQLAWVADDQAELGGTVLLAYHGTTLSNLVEVMRYLDSSPSKLTTSVNEGGYGGDFGSGGNFDYRFDSMRIFGE